MPAIEAKPSLPSNYHESPPAVPLAGWKQLIPSPSAFRSEARYPIDAYSEFMPPP
jgi:hypothetical protein